ncbi:MAG: VOC family protein [Pseudomonadota bacterium]
MTKLREGEAFMPADAYGRSLKGFGVNLLVADMARALDFQTKVLGLTPRYQDPDFAVMTHGGAEWMLHADHTYSSHPLLGLVGDGAIRGAGCELRLYDLDPDAAEARCRDAGYTVLASAADKPHGLREAYLADADGYVWVPGVAL